MYYYFVEWGGGDVEKKRSKSTGELMDELSSVSSIREYFNKNEAEILREKLPERLQALIAERGITRSKLAAQARLDRFYIYDIFNGRKLPGRDKLVCIILALDLDMDAARDLFHMAEKPELYARDPRDSILIFAIQHHKTVDETNNMLYEEGLPLLTD